MNNNYYVEIENIKDGEIISCQGNEKEVFIIGKNIDETYKTNNIQESISIIDQFVSKLVNEGYRVTYKESK